MEKTEKAEILAYLRRHLSSLLEDSDFNMSEAINRGMRPLERKALLTLSDTKKIEANLVEKAISYIEKEGVSA